MLVLQKHYIDGLYKMHLFLKWVAETFRLVFRYLYISYQRVQIFVLKLWRILFLGVELLVVFYSGMHVRIYTSLGVSLCTERPWNLLHAGILKIILFLSPLCFLEWELQCASRNGNVNLVHYLVECSGWRQASFHDGICMIWKNYIGR